MSKNQISQDQIRQSRVLVVGDMMLDRYWFGDVERISPEAPVPVVQVKRSDERLGGAANVARNAAALGAQVGMLGVIGDDEPGRTLEALLAESQRAALPATRSHPQYDDQAARAGPSAAVAARRFRERAGQRSAGFGTGALQCSGGRLSGAGLVRLRQGAVWRTSAAWWTGRAAGRTVLVDPKGDDYSRYRGATLITPNRAEMRAVVGAWKTEADLTIRAQNLRRSLQLEALLLTRSEEGMTLYTEAEVLHVSAQAREVV